MQLFVLILYANVLMTTANVLRTMIYNWKGKYIFRNGVSVQLVNVLKDYRTSINQEIRWMEYGTCAYLDVALQLKCLHLQFVSVDERQ